MASRVRLFCSATTGCFTFSEGVSSPPSSHAWMFAPAGSSLACPCHVVFGDVGRQQPVRLLGGEVVLNKIVMGRRAHFAVLAALLSEHAPPAVVRADPPSGSLADRFTGFACSRDQESVAEVGSSR